MRNKGIVNVKAQQLAQGGSVLVCGDDNDDDDDDEISSSSEDDSSSSVDDDSDAVVDTSSLKVHSHQVPHLPQHPLHIWPLAPSSTPSQPSSTPSRHSSTVSTLGGGARVGRYFPTPDDCYRPVAEEAAAAGYHKYPTTSFGHKATSYVHHATSSGHRVKSRGSRTMSLGKWSTGRIFSYEDPTHEHSHHPPDTTVVTEDNTGGCQDTDSATQRRKVSDGQRDNNGQSGVKKKTRWWRGGDGRGRKSNRQKAAELRTAMHYEADNPFGLPNEGRGKSRWRGASSRGGAGVTTSRGFKRGGRGKVKRLKQTLEEKLRDFRKWRKAKNNQPKKNM